MLQIIARVWIIQISTQLNEKKKNQQKLKLRNYIQQIITMFKFSSESQTSKTQINYAATKQGHSKKKKLVQVHMFL